MSDNRSTPWVPLRVPVVVMVLAATAIPVEMKPQWSWRLDASIQPWDLFLNVAGYVPVGIVLAGLGRVPALLIGTAMAIFAEAAQLVMMHRDTSIIDVAANSIGTAVGIAVSAGWSLTAPSIHIDKRTGIAAIASSVTLLFAVWWTSGSPVNPRGVTAPGTLEAYWKLDEAQGRKAIDSSGHGLDGAFSREPARLAGMRNGAVAFNGTTDYVDAGHSTAFRLEGSMTISAWINSNSYPLDDAAIVSNFVHDAGGPSGGYGLGFQLDTTVDRGPRTIGFKLTDLCGNVMARYGATALQLHTWYHVAGVYNAPAQTLDVYLNGELDNGFLLGSVISTHRPSRRPLFIGRRGDRAGWEFAGAIDDVRIHSRPLTKAEVALDMRRAGVDGAVAEPLPSPARELVPPPHDQTVSCGWSSEREDSRLPGAVAAFGVLVAVGWIAFAPSIDRRLLLLVSLFGGLLFVPITTSTLPAMNAWCFPLTSLLGSASVIFALHRQNASV